MRGRRLLNPKCARWAAIAISGLPIACPNPSAADDGLSRTIYDAGVVHSKIEVDATIVANISGKYSGRGADFPISNISNVSGASTSNTNSNIDSSDSGNSNNNNSSELSLSLYDIPRVSYRLGYISLCLIPPIALAPLLLFEDSRDYWWSWFKKSCVDIGPCMIKLCQWVSTRPDLFPDYICRPLSDFQYKTAENSSNYINSVLQESLGDDWSKHLRLHKKNDGNLVFLGSGCVAVVVKGELLTDKNNLNEQTVAVKILRSGVKESIEIDLGILNILAYYTDKYAGYYFPSMPSLADVVDQFATLMNDQIDFCKEAKNLQKFAKNFEDFKSMNISFPNPISVSNKVLVESFSEGNLMAFHLNDDTSSRKLLAKLGLNAVLKMVFEDNFVHADLHPGNIIVQKKETPGHLQGHNESAASDYKLSLIDAGLVVHLSPKDRNNLVDLFFAVIENNGRKVGQLMIDRSNSQAGVVDVNGFMDSMHEIVSNVNKKGLLLNNIDIGFLLKTIMILCYKHSVKLDSNFASIMVAIIVIEGLGRRLDPTINILKFAAPFILRAQLKINK